MFDNLRRNSGKHPSRARNKLDACIVEEVKKTIVGREDALLIIKERSVQV
jgi:hypothetical protein